MFLRNVIDNYNEKNIKLYVDMDGVIADYDVGKASGYDTKRPLITSISKLEEISKLNNIDMYILSITKKDEGINQKHYWLDKYAPFFKKEKRIIISKESNEGFSSKELKANYLVNVERNKNDIIMVIDDDPEIIKEIKNKNPDIILLKDTVLVD